MSDSDKEIWFPAKRYGWGWGFPVTWQGWAVFVAYICVILGGIQLVYPTRPVAFGILVVIATICFIAICWFKGERPRWRWGKD